MKIILILFLFIASYTIAAEKKYLADTIDSVHKPVAVKPKLASFDLYIEDAFIIMKEFTKFLDENPEVSTYYKLVTFNNENKIALDNCGILAYGLGKRGESLSSFHSLAKATFPDEQESIRKIVENLIHKNEEANIFETDKNFKNTIDRYLRFCHKVGKESSSHIPTFTP